MQQSMQHVPFLHFTVRLTRVIDKATNVSHSVPVDHHATVQVEAVMMSFIAVLFCHSAPEFLLTDNLTKIFKDKLTRRNRFACPYAVSSALRVELLQTLCPVVSLDSLVGAFFATGTSVWIALDEDHAIQAVVAARFLFGGLVWSLTTTGVRLIVAVDRLAIHKHVVANLLVFR